MKDYETARDRLRRMAMRLEDALRIEIDNPDNTMEFDNDLQESVDLAEQLVTLLQGSRREHAATNPQE